MNKDELFDKAIQEINEKYAKKMGKHVEELTHVELVDAAMIWLEQIEEIQTKATNYLKQLLADG